MNLSEQLRQFDGKHIEPLEALGTQLLKREGSVDELLALSNRDDAADADCRYLALEVVTRTARGATQKSRIDLKARNEWGYGFWEKIT